MPRQSARFRVRRMLTTAFTTLLFASYFPSANSGKDGHFTLRLSVKAISTAICVCVGLGVCQLPDEGCLTTFTQPNLEACGSYYSSWICDQVEMWSETSNLQSNHSDETTIKNKNTWMWCYTLTNLIQISHPHIWSQSSSRGIVQSVWDKIKASGPRWIRTTNLPKPIAGQGALPSLSYGSILPANRSTGPCHPVPTNYMQTKIQIIYIMGSSFWDFQVKKMG